MIQTYIKSVLTALGGGLPTMALSDSMNFRKEVYPQYKANRKNNRRPSTLSVVRQLLKDKYNHLQWDRLEADDIIGILGTSRTDLIAVGIDKDFRSIPITYFNPLTWKTIITSPEEALMNFYKQVLTGDPVDGYAGCPGYGPVRAQELLKDASSPTEMWDLVRSTYEERGKSEEDAIRMARMAKILTHGEYNLDTKEITLWTPPTSSRNQ